MTTLSSRENFLRMMQGDRSTPAQRMPLVIHVTAPVIDLIEQHTGTRDVVAALELDVDDMGLAYPPAADKWRAAYKRLGFEMPDDAEVDDLGISHAVPSRDSLGGAWHLREMLHPLSVIESVEQLQTLPWPDMTDPAHYADWPARVEEVHAQGKASMVWLGCSIFEHTWYLRGMDNVFMDLIEGNGIGDWLLDWFTERSVHATRAACRASVDIIQLGDDVGTQRGMMMAPDFWRAHLKPRLKRVIDGIREAEREAGRKKAWVQYHSDGDVREIIPDLVEIGVDILNPVQPECMPPGEVIPAHGHHLAFWGMIGTQTTMPFGTPDDVRAAVSEVASLARNGARVVVAPTHVIEPDVPWDNICALIEAVRSTPL